MNKQEEDLEAFAMARELVEEQLNFHLKRKVNENLPYLERERSQGATDALRMVKIYLTPVYEQEEERG